MGHNVVLSGKIFVLLYNANIAHTSVQVCPTASTTSVQGVCKNLTCTYYQFFWGLLRIMYSDNLVVLDHGVPVYIV